MIWHRVFEKLMAGIIINMSNGPTHTGDCGDGKKLGKENMKRIMKTNVKLLYLLYVRRSKDII